MVHLDTMAHTDLNHVSVVADDLAESARFYEEVFDMERVPTPNFDFDVEWLRMHGGNQLHLFDLDVPSPQYHHFGVVVDDFEAVYREAKARDALTDFSDDENSQRMYELPDGAVQMYVSDPAGNAVEVNWPDVTTLDESIRAEIIDRDDLRPQTGEAADATLGLERFAAQFGGE